ncbi:hypothetical protein J6590_016503 [Homalodisca vitripennis]|nr:hypothetical protein J6590_016503 [Homalodisca vitripennis]
MFDTSFAGSDKNAHLAMDPSKGSDPLLERNTGLMMSKEPNRKGSTNKDYYNVLLLQKRMPPIELASLTAGLRVIVGGSHRYHRRFAIRTQVVTFPKKCTSTAVQDEFRGAVGTGRTRPEVSTRVHFLKKPEQWPPVYISREWSLFLSLPLFPPLFCDEAMVLFASARTLDRRCHRLDSWNLESYSSKEIKRNRCTIECTTMFVTRPNARWSNRVFYHNVAMVGRIDSITIWRRHQTLLLAGLAAPLANSVGTMYNVYRTLTRYMNQLNISDTAS